MKRNEKKQLETYGICRRKKDEHGNDQKFFIGNVFCVRVSHLNAVIFNFDSIFVSKISLL